MVYYIVYEQVIIILVTTITNSVWLIQHSEHRLRNKTLAMVASPDQHSVLTHNTKYSDVEFYGHWWFTVCDFINLFQCGPMADCHNRGEFAGIVADTLTQSSKILPLLTFKRSLLLVLCIKLPYTPHHHPLLPTLSLKLICKALSASHKQPHPKRAVCFPWLLFVLIEVSRLQLLRHLAHVLHLPQLQPPPHLHTSTVHSGFILLKTSEIAITHISCLWQRSNYHIWTHSDLSVMHCFVSISSLWCQSRFQHFSCQTWNGHKQKDKDWLIVSIYIICSAAEVQSRTKVWTWTFWTELWVQFKVQRNYWTEPQVHFKVQAVESRFKPELNQNSKTGFLKDFYEVFYLQT